jgi:hypothetical protein
MGSTQTFQFDRWRLPKQGLSLRLTHCTRALQLPGDAGLLCRSAILATPFPDDLTDQLVMRHAASPA